MREIDITLWINDSEESCWNDSMDYSRKIYPKGRLVGITITEFYEFCKNAARAYGYSDEIVKEWFLR